MRLFITLSIIVLSCFPYANFREYHYSPPSLPFNTGVPAQSRQFNQLQVQPQAAAYYQVPSATIVHHYGLSGTANVNRQSLNNGYISPHGGTTAPQYQTSGQSQLSYNQAGAVGGNNYASTIAASYYSQQQPHHQQQYTLNSNPLTQHQQQTAYGNLPQTQQLTQNSANGRQQQFGTSLNGGFGTAVGLGNGQSPTYAFNGNYISQSESGQLHSYQHQQNPAGDTRPFRRVIKNCLPNGQCQQINLEPGQPDPQHLNNAAVAKAKTVNLSDKCRRIAEAKAAQYAISSGSFNTGGGYKTQNYAEVHSNSIEVNLVRPANRRLFEYSEVVLPNDPYN